MKIADYLRSFFYAIRPFENAQHFAMTVAGFLFSAYMTGSLTVNARTVYGAIAVFSFLSSVLAYNNYATFEEDLQDKTKKFDSKFKGIKISFLFWVAAVFFIICVVSAMLVNVYSAVIFILLMLGWALYTHPVVMLKKGRFVPFILDMLTMPFLAIFGAMLNGPLMWQAIAFSVFFGFIEIAGHINHMTMDYDVDLKTNVNTMAVRVGPKRSFSIAMITFFLSSVYFLCLAIAGLFPLYAGFIYMPGLLVLFWLWLSYFKKGFSSGHARKLRMIYRIIYLIESLALAGIMLKEVNIYRFF